jgi:hypothetical protein
VRGERLHRPLGRQHLERRQGQAVDPVDRPAVAAVGVDIRPGVGEPLPASLGQGREPAAGVAGLALGLVLGGGEAGGGRREDVGLRRQALAGGGADRGVLVAHQVARLGRPGQQLGVEDEPVGRQLGPQPGGVDRRPHPIEQRGLDGGIGEERPARAGDDGPGGGSGRGAAGGHTEAPGRDICVPAHHDHGP